MYRSHHEIETVIGHSLGGAVALSLEKQYIKEGSNPYGIIQSKTFGAPTVSGDLGSSLGKVGKSIVTNSTLDLGVAGGVAMGASADSAYWVFGWWSFTRNGAEICKQISTDMANRSTEDNNTRPDRIRYFGDPVSAMDSNAKAVMPSFKQRFNNSAHSYSGLQIADKVLVHGTMRNNLNPSPDDREAEVITYRLN